MARTIPSPDYQEPTSDNQHPTSKNLHQATNNIRHPTTQRLGVALRWGVGHPLPIFGNGAAREGSQPPNAEQNS